MDKLYTEKKLQDELRELLTEGELYLLCTPGGIVNFCAPALRDLVGQDLIGQNLHRFMADAQVARIIASAQNGRELELDLKVEKHYFRCRMHPMGGRGFVIGFMPVSTEEGDDGRLDSAGLMQQEIREGIQVILSALSQLKPGDNQRDALCQAMIRRQTLKLLRLADNMMDLARFNGNATQLQLSELELAQLLQEFSRDAAQVLDGIGVQMELDLPEEPCFLRGDRDKLLRILLNLVCSSLQNMREQPLRIQIRLTRVGDVNRIVYQDTGPESAELEAASLGGARTRELLGEQLPDAGSWDMELIRAFAKLHNGGLMVTTRSGGQPVYVITLKDIKGKAGGALRSSGIAYQDAANLFLKELSPALPTELYIRK